MKKTVLLFLLLIVIAAGCKKQEDTAYEATGTTGVQTLQDISQLEAPYKDVLAKDPKNFDAAVALGNLYFDSGQPEKAIEAYQKALEINPKDVNVRTDMGTMYRKIGNFDKAVEEFRKSASTDPTHVMSWYNLGVVLYYDKRDMKGAADAWDELLKIAPNHPNALELKQMIAQARNPQAAETKSPESGWVTK